MAQPAVDRNVPRASHDSDEIELQDIGGDDSEREQVNLPPADGGYQAWLMLAGCFVINVLIWGKDVRVRATRTID